jgi:hypothetical protein
MNTVVAASSFTAANGYKQTHKAEVPRPGKHSFYFRVPAGSAALKLDFTGPEGVIKFLSTPDGRVSYIATSEYVTDRPAAGVWEILFHERTDMREFKSGLPQPLPPTPVSVTASLLNAGAEVAMVSVGPMLPGETRTREFHLTNRGASFKGGLLASPLASASRKTVTILDREQQAYLIDVPAGSSQLRVNIDTIAGSTADLDLYLFDCTDGTCRTARSSLDQEAHELVIVNSPRAGRWKAVIDGARIPSGRATYTYTDAILNPRYGSIAVNDPPVEHGAGAQWTASANVWIAESPPAGREPYGLIVIGSAELLTPARYPGAKPLYEDAPDVSAQKQGLATVGTVAVELLPSPNGCCGAGS